MSECSGSKAKKGGFRFSMAERVLRLFDAQKTRAAPEGETRSELSGPLRSQLSVELRCKLRPVGVRCVSVKAGPQGLAAKSKRARSALVFQRIAERLARLEPLRTSTFVESAFVKSALVACELVPVASRSFKSGVGVRFH